MFKILITILKTLVPALAIGMVSYYSQWSLGEYISKLRSNSPLSNTEMKSIDLTAAVAFCNSVLIFVEFVIPKFKQQIMSAFLHADLQFEDVSKNVTQKVYVFEPGSSSVSRVKVKITLKSPQILSFFYRFLVENINIKIEWAPKWLEIEPDILEELQYELTEGMFKVALKDLISHRGGQAVIDLTMQTKHTSTKVEYLKVDLEFKAPKYELLRFCMVRYNSAKCELELSCV